MKTQTRTTSSARAIGRRRFVQLSGAAAALTGASVPLLPARARAASPLTLPAHIAAPGPAPDLAGTTAGVPDGYLTFPKNLVQSVKAPPVTTGPINAFVQTIAQPPTRLADNDYWKAVNAAIGAEMKLNIVPQAQMREKFATLMASGDYPDIAYIPPRTDAAFPAAAAQFIDKACADLTPYLAGDAIAEYPNLANIAADSWNASVFFNSIRGVPVSRAFIGEVLYVRQDIIDRTGIAWPKNADDFKRFAKELTRPAEGLWAMGASPNGWDYNWFNQMFAGPNNWRLEPNGKLTKDIESEECKAAVSFIRELVAAGYFYPDQMPSQSLADTNLLAGKFALRRAAWSNYVNLWNRADASGTGAKIRTLPILRADGGTPVHHLYSGSFGCTVIRKASDKRVRELLGALNTLSAPLGSREHLLLNYGVEGTDFAFDAKGNPILTPKGQADLAAPFSYLGTTRYSLFNPADPEFVRVGYEFAQSVIPHGIKDPTARVFSPTDGAKTGLLTALIYDSVVAIVTGRKPFSAYDDMLAEWRAKGGDQIRAEYMAALGSQPG